MPDPKKNFDFADQVAIQKQEATLQQITSSLQVGNRETGSKNYVTPTQLEKMAPTPGADYLGVGYDIYYGNPEGDSEYAPSPACSDPAGAPLSR